MKFFYLWVLVLFFSVKFQGVIANNISKEESSLENKMMEALCTLETIIASFTQQGLDKQGRPICRQGRLYVHVPQKSLRLIYNGVKPMDVLIAQGKMLIYYPGKKESYEYRSSQCPFYFLLEGNKLPQRLKVINGKILKKNGVSIAVGTLVQKKDPLGQKVILTFSWPDLKILHWSYDDPSGQGAVVGLTYDHQQQFPKNIFSRQKI